MLSSAKTAGGFGIYGRFNLLASGDELAKRFPLAEAPLFEPRYNIAPTQSAAAVRATASGRVLARLRCNSAFHAGELNDERIAEILKAVPEITPTSKKEGRTSSDNTDRTGFAGRQFSR